MNQLFYREIETEWGTAYIIVDSKKIKQFFLPETGSKESFKDYQVAKNISWLESVVRLIQKYFCGNYIKFKLDNIDLSFYTEFQKKVYITLLNVDYGKIITYQELAVRAGYPNACRAVGSAMAKNQTPLLVPCHRVVLSNGDIGNFGPGKKYKQRLLELEGVATGPSVTRF